MHVLYEENGGFKVGSILTDSAPSLQVEAPHGKRSKIKSANVLLRFEAPPPMELMAGGEAFAAQVDTRFLWECCGEAEFGFEELAREYCGRAPTAVEAAGLLFKLHSAPMYFYRKGKGRYRPAPADTLKAALDGLERKRLVQERIDAWVERLKQGAMPDELRSIAVELLYKPDRNKPETKALELACDATGLSAPKLFEHCGALGSSHEYHLGRFLFEQFPRGIQFPPVAPTAPAGELPLADCAAFSLDDAGTTEIDDAFSVKALDDGATRIGIHIAAPALGILPGSELDAIARARLSTVYFPGSKITMLPPEVVQQFSLAEGEAHPAVSLYVDVAEDLSIRNLHTVVERVPIAANLRHHNTAVFDQAFPTGELPELPYVRELHLLWRFALSLEAARGKPSGGTERPEYSFTIEGEHIDISMRRRGEPMDKLVAELMVLVNSTWGKLLDDHDVTAVYRTQNNGKVRMTTGAAAHQGLGVSHYAWSSSPLRRYIDLINQWQLLALLAGEPAPFRRNSAELLSAVSDFEATYAAYSEFQRQMEHYWCLRWLLQEGKETLTGEVLRENLVRIDGLPMVLRVPSLPALDGGARVELGVTAVDLLEATLQCQFRRVLETAGAT